MAEDNSTRKIWLVFWILLVLTAIEVLLGIFKPSFMISMYFIGVSVLNLTFIILTLVKAYYIVAIFMHVVWERLALVWAILGPPIVLLVLIGFMAIEGNYTEGTRYQYRGDDPTLQPLSPSDLHHEESSDATLNEH